MDESWIWGVCVKAAFSSPSCYMNMAIDQTRRQFFTGGVNDPAACASLQRLSYSLDAAAAY